MTVNHSEPRVLDVRWDLDQSDTGLNHQASGRCLCVCVCVYWRRMGESTTGPNASQRSISLLAIVYTKAVFFFVAAPPTSSLLV